MADHACPCGAEIVQPLRGRPRKFCLECRPRSRVQQPVAYVRCAYCKTLTTRPRFCSDTCQQRAAVSVKCSDCGGWAYTSKKRKAAGVPSRCLDCKRRDVYRSVEACEACSTPFVSVRRSDGRATRFCSKSCARRALYAATANHPLIQSNRSRALDPTLTTDERRRQNGELVRRARRARLAQVAHDPYTRDEIADRDGFTCWLCGGAVDMALRFPHPKSASIDHVVPLSLGGDDTRANVRLAHLGENIARGNRVDWTPDVAS